MLLVSITRGRSEMTNDRPSIFSRDFDFLREDACNRSCGNWNSIDLNRSIVTPIEILLTKMEFMLK
uniref:Uncharacterized protein n=1 Tax=Meloidogyne enterolobii TaxID=390850 RepID=A0A6V7WTU3_MELEN|nr:unnamed protein product [Meloidogyne enterolobii]